MEIQLPAEQIAFLSKMHADYARYLCEISTTDGAYLLDHRVYVCPSLSKHITRISVPLKLAYALSLR